MTAIRRKTRCGITLSFRIADQKDGSFKLRSAGKARMGRDPIPLDFVPFEITNAVINGPRFDTLSPPKPM